MNLKNIISYTQVDHTWAEWIAWQLEAAGYTTVIQAWDFRPVAYPWAADKYLRPLASRLSSVNQLVMLARNAFSTPRPTQLAWV